MVDVWGGEEWYHRPPKQQPDETLDQDNPVSATEYPVLAATSNVRIIGVSANVTWTVQPNLQVHITVDGELFTYTIAAPVTATPYATQQIDLSLANTAQVLSAILVTELPFKHEGKVITVTAETTGGTTQNLAARVKWARWP